MSFTLCGIGPRQRRYWCAATSREKRPAFLHFPRPPKTRPNPVHCSPSSSKHAASAFHLPSHLHMESTNNFFLVASRHISTHFSETVRVHCGRSEQTDATERDQIK